MGEFTETVIRGWCKEPFYVDERARIALINNPDDGADAYDVVVGKDSFYIPSRSLEDLTKPGVSAEGVVRILANVNPDVGYLLEQNDVSPEDLRASLLQTRIKMLEERSGRIAGAFV